MEDSDSGLTYMQARYYDPTAGSFLSPDPAGLAPGDPLRFGRYGYASENPLTNIDPDGRQTLPLFVYQTDWTRQQTRQGLVKDAIPLVPVVSDIQDISDAIDHPTPVTIAAAIIGVVPEGGGPASRILKGAADGERAGKAFTRAGKAEVKAENAAAHEGKIVCETCGVETVPAQQSRKGATPPGNETHVDHIIPKSKNGNGSPGKGKVLCRDCNLDEGADHE